MPPIHSDCIRSGIGAIKAIEATMQTAAIAAIRLPWEVGKAPSPLPYEVQHAFAVSIGCDGNCGLRWHYDFAEHEFYSSDDGACAQFPPMSIERISAIIASAIQEQQDYLAYLMVRAAQVDDLEQRPRKVKATCGGYE
jgi:hypothetical protein